MMRGDCLVYGRSQIKRSDGRIDTALLRCEGHDGKWRGSPLAYIHAAEKGPRVPPVLGLWRLVSTVE